MSLPSPHMRLSEHISTQRHKNVKHFALFFVYRVCSLISSADILVCHFKNAIIEPIRQEGDLEPCRLNRPLASLPTEAGASSFTPPAPTFIAYKYQLHADNSALIYNSRKEYI